MTLFDARQYILLDGYICNVLANVTKFLAHLNSLCLDTKQDKIALYNVFFNVTAKVPYPLKIN